MVTSDYYMNANGSIVLTYRCIRDSGHRHPLLQLLFLTIRSATAHTSYTQYHNYRLYLKMEQQIRDELSGEYNNKLLEISKGRSFMFDNIDSFLALSRENTSVRRALLCPFDSAPGNYEFWDKVGQIVGNLTELETIEIHFHCDNDDNDDDDNDDDDVDEARIPNWETLTRILPHFRRKISLHLCTGDYDAEVEEIQGLARAIYGHPMISEFISEMKFSFEHFGPWCSALATLPFLESVVFGL
jgi:hypothetical protein